MHSTPFKFRLERVRALREREQDFAREQLAVTLGVVRDGEAAVAGADAARRTAGDRQRRAAGSELSGPDLLRMQAYRERSERSVEEARRDLARREAAAAEARRHLTTATLEREALERLKARRLREHVRADQTRAAAFLDDLAGRMRPQAGAA